MTKALVVFFVLSLTCFAEKQTLPNGNTIETLANGEIWVTLKSVAVAFQVTPNMPTSGKFQTSIVENLPESDIVGAPQSLQVQIWGDCQSKTYQVMGTLAYEGKMQSGLPVGSPTEPEDVLHRVEAGSPIEKVFKIVCR